MVASLFTTGENKVEAMLYGIVMWAFLFAVFVAMGAVGIRAGFSAMLELNNTAQAETSQGWEKGGTGAAGVSAEQIAEWRTKLAGTPDAAAQTEQLKKTMTEAGTRITWYAFLGMWLSMMAAAWVRWSARGRRFDLSAWHRQNARGFPVADRMISFHPT